MNLFDTHCHLDFEPYAEDRAAVIARARAAGVQQMVIPAVDLANMERARAIVEAEDGILMAVGIHPNSTAAWSPEYLGSLRAWAQAPKVVALGEIGLDYYWDKSPKTVQQRAFEDQLALAAELGLPVIIHNRDASQDVLPILENWVKALPSALKDRPGVLHSFLESSEAAERALSIGFFLGFTGSVTYKNKDALRRIAAAVPADKIVIETDAPFLTPSPHRGERNEPAFVALVAERIAALRRMETEAFAALTTANAERLFGL